MILYHYTDKKINKLQVKFAFDNSYSQGDLKACNIKRLFFYTDKQYKESFFKSSKYCYTVNIKDNYIYDLRSDKRQLKNKYSNIYDIINAIKRLKYKGIIYNVGFNIVNLFNDVKVIQDVTC